MRPSASTSALPPPDTTLTAEQRKQRLIESRKKYSTRPMARHHHHHDSSLNSSKNSTSNLAPPPPPNFSRPLAPRMSRAPSDSRLPNALSSSRHLNPPRHQNLQNAADDDDFRIDHRSMAMIESGNVVIPRRDQHRPSMYGRGVPRNTIGGGVSRPMKFRNSVAPQQEPRQSLFPLGINIFTASEAQKSEVEGWLKERIEAATPAKQQKSSSSLLLDATKSTQRTVRFKEATPPVRNEREEDQDQGKENLSGDSEDVVTTTTSSTMTSGIRTAKFENFSSPVSILKVERKKTTTYSATPIPIRRRINFDDDEDDKEKVLTTSKCLQNLQNSDDEKKEAEEKSVEKKIEALKRIVTDITDTSSSSPPTSSEIEELRKVAGNLVDWLNKHQSQESEQQQQIKKKTTSSSSQLVPICEDEDENEEEEGEDEDDVDVKTFRKLKIGEISPQKLLQQQQPLLAVDNNTTSEARSSTPFSSSDLDQAFLD